ncbi:unnamed protein product, partial [Porites lobata]
VKFFKFLGVPFRVFRCCFALSLGFVKQEGLHIQNQPFSYRCPFHGDDRLFVASDLARFLIILQTVVFSLEQQAPSATCLPLQSNILLAFLALTDFTVGILVQPTFAVVLIMLLLNEPRGYCVFQVLRYVIIVMLLFRTVHAEETEMRLFGVPNAVVRVNRVKADQDQNEKPQHDVNEENV